MSQTIFLIIIILTIAFYLGKVSEAGWVNIAPTNDLFNKEWKLNKEKTTYKLKLELVTGELSLDFKTKDSTLSTGLHHVTIKLPKEYKTDFPKVAKVIIKNKNNNDQTYFKGQLIPIDSTTYGIAPVSYKKSPNLLSPTQNMEVSVKATFKIYPKAKIINTIKDANKRGRLTFSAILVLGIGAILYMKR